MAGQNVNNAAAFLRNYAAQGGQVQMQNAQGQYVNASPQQVQAALHQAQPTPAQPGQPGQPQPAQLTPAQQAAQQQRLDNERRRARQQSARSGATAALAGAGGFFGGLRERVNALSERAGNAPTPGGIGAMLVILGVLVSAVVPVNQGYTRLQLAWMTLLGQTYIPEAQAVEDARDSGQLGNSANLASDVGNILKGALGGIGGTLTTGAQGHGSGPSVVPGSVRGNTMPTLPGATVKRPTYGQLPIAPPLPSSGRRF